MAKALLGHVRGPDQRIADELRRLRQRVGDLEAQLARLKEEHGTALPRTRAALPRTRAALPSSRAAPPGSQAVPLGPATPPEPRKPPA